MVNEKYRERLWCHTFTTVNVYWLNEWEWMFIQLLEERWNPGLLESSSPWGLVLWVLAMEIASRSRKSKIRMKWLFQELPQARRDLRTSSL